MMIMIQPIVTCFLLVVAAITNDRGEALRLKKGYARTSDIFSQALFFEISNFWTSCGFGTHSMDNVLGGVWAHVEKNSLVQERDEISQLIGSKITEENQVDFLTQQ